MHRCPTFFQIPLFGLQGQVSSFILLSLISLICAENMGESQKQCILF